MHPLEPGGTFAFPLRTAGFSDSVGAFLVAQGNATGLAYISAGDPCPDLRAGLAQLKARRAALKGQIVQVQKHLARAQRAVRQKRFGEAATQLRAARERLAGLRQRAAEWDKAVKAAEGLSGCGGGATRNAAAGAACDTEWIATGRTAGTVRGLTQALEGERRIGRTAKRAAVLVKRVGGAGVRPAVARLTALVLWR